MEAGLSYLTFPSLLPNCCKGGLILRNICSGDFNSTGQWELLLRGDLLQGGKSLSEGSSILCIGHRAPFIYTWEL